MKKEKVRIYTTPKTPKVFTVSGATSDITVRENNNIIKPKCINCGAEPKKILISSFAAEDD